MDYFEKDLEIPFLKVLSEHREGLSMSSIKKILMERLEPTGTALEQSPTRHNEIKLQQRIGNFTPLRERRIFVNGLVTYDEKTGLYKITNKGIEFLSNNEEIYADLISQGFTRKQREKEIDKDYTDLVIEEGSEKEVTSKQRKRSQILRQEKIKEIKQKNNGKISCVVCGFNFADKYDGYGEGYIEIHHLEPVSYGSKTQDIKEALKKVVPLCSNCHRMVHKNRGKLLSIEELKNIIKN
jgi:predicted HNH restriction endonuclease